MEADEAVEKLEADNPFWIDQKRVVLGQTTLLTKKENLEELLTYLKAAGFDVLTDLSAVDYLEPLPRTEVIYFLHNLINNSRIRIAVLVDRNEAIPSIIGLWAGAAWYEREVYDLFGVRFDGHPQLKRILMPDDWHGHPLRKDYTLMEEGIEFKHGVMPKVPSETIPHVKNTTRP